MRTLMLVAALAAAPYLPAEEAVFDFDPAQTHVTVMVGSTLHTVHGTFQLKRGLLRLEPATGKASGELIVDAMSGETGNSSRDHRMENSILEAAKFREIVFRPDRIEGKLPEEGSASLQVHGILSLHGADHEMTIPVKAQMEKGRFSATLEFQVPYIQWGMKNPSTFILRVNETAQVEIQASGLRM
jgi:polyisoprenoid-binding protein YceI